MPTIKFIQEWRDYKANAEVDTLSDRICEELIGAGFAERVEREGKDEQELKMSLGYKYSSLKTVGIQIKHFENELERLKEKEDALLAEIENLEKEIVEEIKEPKKGKLNRIAKEKEVEVKTEEKENKEV
jgi:nucleotidyltransferase/DNA polymerase involved in DNA repair